MQKGKELNSLFKLLADSQRRKVISRLYEKGGEFIVSDEEKRIEMHHVHLPKLEERGIVEYDVIGGAMKIQRGDRWEDISVLAETLSKNDLV